MRIVVAGLAAAYPLGGPFWDYTQYVAGFRALGHEVLYLEDTGRWTYDPAQRRFVESGRVGAEWLARHLQGPWFFRDAQEATWGVPWAEAAEFCRTADLFLNVSAAAILRDEYRAARLALVDTDPGFTQGGPPDAPGWRTLREHDVHFTYGEAFTPPGDLRWIPTRQPVLLPSVEAPRRPVFTTVGSWDRGGADPGLGKSVVLLEYMALPSRVSQPLELALSGDFPVSEFEDAGWRLADAAAVSATPSAYLGYLAGSLAEWSVAKRGYAGTGWFSGRTACYLTLGVPAVVQDTGWPGPVGQGLLTFSTPAEAAACVEEVAAHRARHAAVARELGLAEFGYERVLEELLSAAW